MLGPHSFSCLAVGPGDSGDTRRQAQSLLGIQTVSHQLPSPSAGG